jgi:hypothetical protein
VLRLVKPSKKGAVVDFGRCYIDKFCKEFISILDTEGQKAAYTFSKNKKVPMRLREDLKVELDNRLRRRKELNEDEIY